VDELDERPGLELFDGEPERSLPGRIQTLELAVEAELAEHVDRDREVAIELVCGIV
jgi:hypothetical protein